MSPRTSPLPTLLLAGLLLARPLAARADGAPIGPAPTEAQSRPSVGSDLAGGAIVSYKTASLRVGAVHVNAAGVPDGGFGFGPSALPVSLEASEPLRTAVASASQLRVVADRAAAATPVLTQVQNGGGASVGYPVSLPMPLRHPAIVAGLSGRTLLVAKDDDATSFWTLRAAIIRANGTVQFSIQVSSQLQFFNADAIDACSDGAGGLIAAMPYYDFNSTGSRDVAVWRLTATGARPWGDQAVPVVSASSDQTDVHIVSDGKGGALMAWTDARADTRSTDIFALRIDSTLTRAPGWNFYGSAVCDALGAQSQPRITPDGSGGMWVVWLDQRLGLDGDLRYSHVLGNGALAAGFTSDGTPLCSAAGAQGETALAGDGAGGFFAVWRDDRSGNADIYAQHILASGAVAAGWVANGRALTTAAGAQDQPAIASVLAGKAVVAWRDARAGTTRIYATGVSDPATTDVAPEEATGLRLAAMSGGRHAAEVRVTLPAGPTAVLELLDVSGRVWANLRLAGPLHEQAVGLVPEAELAAGVYFARLRQGARTASTRLTVLR
jgi:hypothetical protein